MRFTRPDGRIVGIASLLAAASPGFDWPQFRGPNAAGVAEESNLPVVFGPEENAVWRTPLPPGPSSPSIAGDRIFVRASTSAPTARSTASGRRAETYPGLDQPDKLELEELDRDELEELDDELDAEELDADDELGKDELLDRFCRATCVR
jgi:hypothetical protein